MIDSRCAVLALYFDMASMQVGIVVEDVVMAVEDVDIALEDACTVPPSWFAARATGSAEEGSDEEGGYEV